MTATESQPCHCRVFHLSCDPSTCPQAKFSREIDGDSVSLKAFKLSASKGCETCAIIANAVNVPEIREVWRAMIPRALESQNTGWIAELEHDEEAIGVALDPPETVNDRRLLRVFASSSSQDWLHFNLWLEESPDSKVSGCKAVKPLTYQPTDRTDSHESLGHLKSWIEACERSHGCFQAEKSMLPTRVIQVTNGKLCIVTNPGHHAFYTTLSHKWGDCEPLKLNRSNIGDLHREIPYEDVPRTFLDAIWLTRQLGIDYIWIDSLCIIQDDPDDWRSESVKMRDVYGNSYLNIAASHAANASGGLFTSTDMPQRYPVYSIPNKPNHFIRAQPYLDHTDFGSTYAGFERRWQLLTRGWVLQERLLAPRVVYFDTDELKWECMKTADCQCGAIVSMWNFKVDYSGSVFRSEIPLSFGWMRIAEQYSNLTLTYDTDRAVALSGIARQALLSGRGGRYLAGVWEKDLAHQLCWEIGTGCRKPETYIAPSWSWLSIFGSVRNFNRMESHMQGCRIDVVITDVQVKTIAGTDETGPVESGYLKLNGRCEEMDATLLVGESWPHPPRYGLITKKGEEFDGYVEMDYLMSDYDAEKITEVLVVYWGYMEPGRDNFLVLKPVEGREGTYERFGIFWYKTHDDEYERSEFDRVIRWCEERRDITII